MERGAKAGQVMAWAGRIVLAGVFIYAGAAKALEPAAFADAIDSYRLLSHPAGVVLALYLPWLEITGGLGILWSRTRLGALSLLFLLCLMFAIAVASAWIRDLDIACGCFGGGAVGAAALRSSLFRSAALAFLAGALLWVEEARHVGPGASAGSM